MVIKTSKEILALLSALAFDYEYDALLPFFFKDEPMNRRGIVWAKNSLLS